MIETLIPYAGTLFVFGCAWFMLHHTYEEYKTFDKFGVKEFWFIVPKGLFGLAFLGTGIWSVLWILGFRF